MGLNPFVRRLEWLFAALKLQEPDLPHLLQADVVYPQVDALQGGYPFSQIQHTINHVSGATVVGGVTMDGAIDLFGALTLNGRFALPNRDVQLIIWAMSWRHTVGATPIEMEMFVTDATLGAGSATQLSRFTVPAVEDVTHREIAGATDAVIIVPPNHTVGFQFATALPVGEQIQMRASAFVVPAGLRWW